MCTRVCLYHRVRLHESDATWPQRTTMFAKATKAAERALTRLVTANSFLTDVSSAPEIIGNVVLHDRGRKVYSNGIRFPATRSANPCASSTSFVDASMKIDVHWRKLRKASHGFSLARPPSESFAAYFFARLPLASNAPATGMKFRRFCGELRWIRNFMASEGEQREILALKNSFGGSHGLRRVQLNARCRQ